MELENKWFCSGISLCLKIDLRQLQGVVNESHRLEDGSLEVLCRNEQENKSFLVKKLDHHQCKLEFGNFCLLSRSICCPLFFYFSKCVSSRLLLLWKRFGFGFGFSGFGIQCWCAFGECSTGRVNYNITKVTKDKIRKTRRRLVGGHYYSQSVLRRMRIVKTSKPNKNVENLETSSSG
jgi:hypothetical protein